MNLNNITSFINNELPLKLQNDLQSLKIIKEADVECCAYYHFRQLFGDQSEWRVLARKHAKLTGHFVDLIIFDNDIPVIAIELKWNKSSISSKDRKSLESAIKWLGVHKAYWISMTMSSTVSEIERLDTDKYQLFQKVIPLDLDDENKKEWTKRRKSFMAEMKPRKSAVST